MIFSLFKKKSNDQIDLAIPTHINLHYIVYVRTESASLQMETIAQTIANWLKNNIKFDDEFFTQGIMIFTTQIAQFHIREKSPIETPEDLQELFGLDDYIRGIYNRCNQEISIICEDMIQFPRIGLLTSYICAHVFAEAFDGCIYDPSTKAYYAPRANELINLVTPMLPISQHIYTYYAGNKGVGWVCTSGMDKFGLPDLSIAGVAPEHKPAATRIINALAHHLHIQILKRNDSNKENIQKLTIHNVLEIHREDVARSMGEIVKGPEKGGVYVNLHLKQGDNGYCVLIITPPDRFNNTDEWLSYAMGVFYGDIDTFVKSTGGNSRQMEDAHNIAVATLPDAKQRYLNGLPADTMFLVKYGFPKGNGTFEYMWVDVKEWKGEMVYGILTNEPQYIKNLHEGDVCSLKESDIYDWFISNADGSEMSGGYTMKVMM